jgi:hypothetical protein
MDYIHYKGDLEDFFRFYDPFVGYVEVTEPEWDYPTIESATEIVELDIKRFPHRFIVQDEYL